jgi:transcriptional regulator with XRE-family HTH domain
MSLAEGLSERELACGLGIKPGTMATWETGVAVRPRAHIRAIFERYLATVGPGGSAVEEERDGPAV